MSLKDKLKTELEKIRKMNAGERWSYFKTYYLSLFLIGLIVFVLLLHFCFDMKQNNREVLSSGCLVNVSIKAEGVVFLTDDYVDACDKSLKDAVSYLSTDNTLKFMEDNPLDQDSYEMALTAQIFAGEYSYMILDETALSHFEKDDFYANLEKTLTQSQCDRLKDRMVSQKMQDGEYPVAINLTDTKVAEFFTSDAKNIYLIFVDVQQDVSKNQQLIEYLLP